jgi:hypothetical protein
MLLIVVFHPLRLFMLFHAPLALNLYLPFMFHIILPMNSSTHTHHIQCPITLHLPFRVHSKPNTILITLFHHIRVTKETLTLVLASRSITEGRAASSVFQDIGLACPEIYFAFAGYESSLDWLAEYFPRVMRRVLDVDC